jgi:hypothetical protein
MSKESMTPKERWLAVFNRETPDRLPMNHIQAVSPPENIVAYLLNK